MVNSSDKGKRGEREFAAFLREHGWEARRGQQFAGGDDSPDVISSVPGIHFEVKRVERLNIHAANDQAEEDAGDLVPVVAHRRSRDIWYATLPMKDLLQLIAKSYCN